MTETTDQAPTDHVGAAKELKRFAHSMRHVLALADEIETWAGIERSVVDANARLVQVSEQEQAARGAIAALGHISDIEKTTEAVSASLLNAQNSEAALQKRLTELEAKCAAATATVAELDKAVASKRGELAEIESALSVLKQRLAG